MKKILLLPVAMFFAAFMLISCGNDSDVRDNAASTLDVPEATADPVAPPTAVPTVPPATTTPTTASGEAVPHYICPNGHGGNAAKGTCPQCGAELAHNQAYHNQPSTTPTTPITPTQPATNAATGQNAAGVWHYICNNGCEGGTGSAGNCPGCGNPLAHNQAYHN